MRDYYYILGIFQSSTEHEIKTAYRKLSMKFHPDKNNGEKFYEERFKEIQEGYEILSNPLKRREYDARLNQFTSSRTNRDNLKNTEEELRNKFEEEFRKREAEIKRNYQAREERINNEAERKIKEENFRSAQTLHQTKERGVNYTPLFITICIAALAIFIYFKYNEQKSIKQSQLAIGDTTTKALTTNLVDTASNSFFSIKDLVLILNNGSQMKFSDFPSSDYLRENKDWKKFSFTDIDNDDIPELTINFFTGGAHCCFEYFIFKQISKNTFKQIFTFEGGEGALTIDGSEIKINFFEQIGYFFTCYACGISDSLPHKYFSPQITLNYSKDKFTLAPTDDYLNKTIIEDLEYLKNRTVPIMDTTDNMDDGTRRAFAERIITYFFNNHENLYATKILFQTYYFGEDRTMIWDNIEKQIANILNMQFAIDNHFKELERNIANMKGTN